MATRTLSELRAECRQRADMETDDSFITDAECTRMVNQSIRELYDLLLANQGQEFYITSATITSDGRTNGTYALPNGTLYSSAPAFYRLLGVDAEAGTSEQRTLHPFKFHERNQYVGLGVGWSRYDDVRYRIQGSNIVFMPAPQNGMSITLWYVPQITALSGDSDTFDGFGGWEEYVIVDVAAKMMEKEESDSTALLLRKAQLTSRIEGLASERDQAYPETVIDVTGRW